MGAKIVWHVSCRARVRPVPKGVQPVHLHRAPKNVGPPN